MQEILKRIGEFVEKGLSIDFKEAIIQLVATLILFLIVRYFFWKPITEILRKRREAMDREIIEARRLSEEAKTKATREQEDAEKLKIELNNLMITTRAEAKLIREKIINDAKVEAGKRIAKADRELERQIRLAQDDIKNQVVEIAFAIAEKIVQKSVDRKQYQDLITEEMKKAGIK